MNDNEIIEKTKRLFHRDDFVRGAVSAHKLDTFARQTAEVIPYQFQHFSICGSSLRFLANQNIQDVALFCDVLFPALWNDLNFDIHSGSWPSFTFKPSGIRKCDV